MISKIKIAAAAVLMVVLAMLFGLYLLERSRNLSLQTEQAQLREKLRLSELRKKISETPVKEIKSLHRKGAKGHAVSSAKNSGSNAESKLAGADLCRACFQDYEYQVEVKDDAGRWLFSDDNIFDERPGRLTLTDKFWQEVAAGKPDEKALLAAPAHRLKNRVLVGFELDRYKVEYAYSPLGYRAQKLDLGLSLYSSLAMSYASAPLEARAGIGVEVRF